MTKIEYAILLVYPIVLFFAYARVLCRGQVRCCHMECLREKARQEDAVAIRDLHSQRRSGRRLESDATRAHRCEETQGSDSILLGRPAEGVQESIQQELFDNPFRPRHGHDESGRTSSGSPEESN